MRRITTTTPGVLPVRHIGTRVGLFLPDVLLHHSSLRRYQEDGGGGRGKEGRRGCLRGWELDEGGWGWMGVDGGGWGWMEGM